MCTPAGLGQSGIATHQELPLITRPRLLAALDQALARRLTLVIAPAGYGKTTLLAEWAQRWPAQVIWLALSEMDNDQAHFLHSMLITLRARGETLATPDPSNPLAYSLSQLFQQSARPAGEPWLLILDDYHLITNPAVHQAVDIVLGLPDWPAHVIIAGRSQPPLTAIARLRVEGRLAELDEADLRFTPEETGSFMAADGLALQEGETRQIVERTEGWPTALRLLCQTAQRAPRADVLTVLSRIGDERPLFDYLAGQVLARQPQPVQDFLRRTALLPWLSAELCNAYLGIATAAALLDELERQHLFISRVNEAAGRRYRYHALFQAFLSRCLEQTEGADATGEWRRRAAACLLQQAGGIDDQAAAVEHLLAVHDWTGAAQIIETLADALDFGSVPRLEPWLARLPAEVMMVSPRLLVALGQLRERQGRWAEALTALAQAEQTARAAGKMRELTHAYRWQAWVHFRQDHYAESIALCQQALSMLPADNTQETAAIYSILANCYGNLNELDQEQEYHRRALELFSRLGDRERETLTLHNMAAHYLSQGLLRETIATEQTTLRTLEELRSYRVCFPLITLGQAYLECGEFERARAVLERLLRLTDAYQDAFRRGYALLLLGHLHREQGNPAAARACYDEARGIAGLTQDHFVCFELCQGEARLALDAGDLREAQRQAHLAFQGAHALPGGQLEGRALITLGQIADAAGNTPQAEAHYTQAVRLAETAHDRLGQAILHLRLADLCRRDGRAEEAQAHLGQAMALSQAHSYDFLFTGRERACALPLLAHTLADGEAAQVAEAGRLLALIGAPAVEPLIALLDTAEAAAQARIIALLGEIGDARAIPALIRLRRNRSLREIVQAALNRIASAPQPLLRVLALGDFQVWRGGERVPSHAWQTRRKARLLLLYLLSRAPSPVACDELIETLWPDLPPDSARRALNTTFSDLRHILEPHLGRGQASRYLARDEETLAFTGRIAYDVAEFQEAMKAGGQGAWQALDLYRGDFLPEEPYADWALRERERLRELYLNTLTARLDEQVQAGAWREGVELARRILDLEPWLEEVWRALMLCLARLGRRSEALQAYQSCVRALRQELDVAPSAETQSLRESLIVL